MNKSLNHPKLWSYTEEMTTPLNKILQEIERETHLEVLSPEMLSGPFQGQLLRFLSLMIKPKRILEIGTFTGYSALCLSEGLGPKGELITIESKIELQPRILKNIQKAEKENCINLLIGDACALLEKIDGKFDLVFVDASKDQYQTYFEAFFPKLEIGAWIISDNVLWKGKFFEETKDNKTQHMHRYNEMLRDHPKLESVMLPFNDGITISRKVSD